MSDDAQAPEAPENAAPVSWSSPSDGSASLPADRISGAGPEDAVPAEGRARGLHPEDAPFAQGRAAEPQPQAAPSAAKIDLDKAAEVRPAEVNPWAPPADTGRQFGGMGTPTAPPAHDQPTVTALPGAGTPGPQPWQSPYAPPGNPFAPPHLHAPYAGPTQGEPVPPPPVGPEGPGQIPYGYGFPGYGPPPPGAYHGAPGYGWPALPPQPSNGMGTAGLVLGILAAIVFCLWPLAIVLGILGIVFGAIGRRKARRGEATNPGQALAGIICGAVGLALAVAVVVFLFVVPDDSGNGNSTTGDSGYSTSLVAGHTR